MKLFLLGLIMTLSLSAHKLNMNADGNILLTPKEYVTMITPTEKQSTPVISVVSNSKPTEYFTLTSENIGGVLEAFTFLVFIIGTVMLYRFKIATIENNFSSMKETIDDHENRIKVNEQNQSQYATKEAIEKEIGLQNTGLEALKTLQNALKSEII